MLRYVVAALCGMSLTGSVYMAGWGHCQTKPVAGETCCDEMPAKEVAVKADTLKIPDGVTDVKNSKCIVMGDDIGTSTQFVTFGGKAYHICCEDCVKDFNKDPEKFVKALEKDPAKFGLARKSD
jgi:YHS domain-containing protein